MKERIYVFSGLAFNMTLILLLAIFIASEIQAKHNSSANLRIKAVNRIGLYKRVHFYPGIDLSSQFNWHTRMIFVYLTCRSGTNTEEMVWSKIVKNGDHYDLNGLERSNYFFNCDGGRQVVFELRANVFPYVGKLKDISLGEQKWEGEV